MTNILIVYGTTDRHTLKIVQVLAEDELIGGGVV